MVRWGSQQRHKMRCHEQRDLCRHQHMTEEHRCFGTQVLPTHTAPHCTARTTYNLSIARTYISSAACSTTSRITSRTMATPCCASRMRRAPELLLTPPDVAVGDPIPSAGGASAPVSTSSAMRPLSTHPVWRLLLLCTWVACCWLSAVESMGARLADDFD